MSLVENYLTENGYDYFGNAAEDTLLFFVRDNEAPLVESWLENRGAIIHTSNDAEMGVSGLPLAERVAVNHKTHAQVYEQNKGEHFNSFRFSQENEPAENQYSDGSV